MSASVLPLDAIALALRYAALSAEFSPEYAVDASGIGTDLAGRMSVVVALSNACGNPSYDVKRWCLLGKERHRLMWQEPDIILRDGSLPEAVSWRAEQLDMDDDAREISDAILGRDRYAPDALTTLLAAPIPGDDLASDLLHVAWVIWAAGPSAPSRSLAEPLRATGQSTWDARSEARYAEWMARHAESLPMPTCGM